MERYILQYASMNFEGVLSMDCLGPFNSKENAKLQQMKIMDGFAKENSSMADAQIKEEIGNFQRIAYKNHLTEIQSRIIKLEACQTLPSIDCKKELHRN